MKFKKTVLWSVIFASVFSYTFDQPIIVWGVRMRMSAYEYIWMAMNGCEWIWIGLNVYEWVWIGMNWYDEHTIRNGFWFSRYLFYIYFIDESIAFIMVIFQSISIVEEFKKLEIFFMQDEIVNEFIFVTLL